MGGESGALLEGLAILLVLKGIALIALPGLYRQMIAYMSEVDERSLRLLGGGGAVAGAFIFWLSA